MSGTDANEPMPHDPEGEAAGSKVVLFPGRVRPVAEISASEVKDAADRLEQALRILTQALVEQREAIRAWRHGLMNLTGSMDILANSFCALDAGLDTASTSLKTGTDENGREAIRSYSASKGATPAQEQPLDPLVD